MEQVIEREETKIEEIKFRKIVLPSLKSSVVVDLSEIEYLESHGCYTEFSLVNGTRYTSSKPLLYYDELLRKYNFFRVHNKYIVNIEHVKGFAIGLPLKLILTSGNLLHVSRLKKNDFMKLYLH
ncbi:MAG: LytTR family transcriptional regulator [Bacteroidales bacterium]|nr:LytTR family transcriptional regulator [Bacteroidales bacterium]